MKQMSKCCNVQTIKNYLGTALCGRCNQYAMAAGVYYTGLEVNEFDHAVEAMCDVCWRRVWVAPGERVNCRSC